MKENLKVKCHICDFETSSKGIGSHYSNTHDLALNQNLNVYLEYFEYNKPGILKDIKEMISNGNGLKYVQKKYPDIGMGSLPILKKALNDFYPDNFMELVTKKSRQTYKDKTGKNFSDDWSRNISGFSNKELASRASLIRHSKEGSKEELKKFLTENNPSHNLEVVEKRKRTYHNKTEKEKNEIIKKRIKTCIENNSYLKRAETIIKKYGGFVCYGNKTGGHSSWHDSIKKIFEENKIITQSEKTVVNNYTSDEVDFERKVIIELMGDFWHCNPKSFNSDYFHPIIKKTAEEIWSFDKKRIEDYKNNGWNVFLIWESDNINEKIKQYKELYG